MLKLKLFICLVVVLFLELILFKQSIAQTISFGERLCLENSNYLRFTVKKGDTWESLWPDPDKRLQVQKINRSNIPLKADQYIAVPTFPVYNFNDYCPFEIKVEYVNIKTLIWNPQYLAWAAYDEKGNLKRWGPGAGGMDYCGDVGRPCRTKTGEFKVLYIHGPNHRSSKYPLGCTNNCAKMPYAITFDAAGYAFHEGKLLGDHSSHGCIRLFKDDAKWLNEDFIDSSTQIIILPYDE